MKLEHILKEYVNRGDRPRKIGRYWSSEIQYIKKGYVTPESFFDNKEIDIGGCRLICTGIAMEDLLTKIFEEQGVECKMQEKKVIKIGKEIELVVKPDFVFDDFVLETKFPFSMVQPGKIPERYLYQLECEHRAFNKPVYAGFFSVPFNLTFEQYPASKRRWSNIQKIVVKFHNEVKEYHKEKTMVVNRENVGDKK